MLAGVGVGVGVGVVQPPLLLGPRPKIARARVRFAPLKGWTIELPGAEGECPTWGFLS